MQTVYRWVSPLAPRRQYDSPLSIYNCLVCPSSRLTVDEKVPFAVLKHSFSGVYYFKWNRANNCNGDQRTECFRRNTACGQIMRYNTPIVSIQEKLWGLYVYLRNVAYFVFFHEMIYKLPLLFDRDNFRWNGIWILYLSIYMG